MDRFGVVSPRLKALAKTPEFPKPILMEEGKAHATIEWHGLQIKNLDTLGERSATGMDTERGVYVISVNALGSVLRDYIRPNDVILELGGKTVNNLADLQKAVQETDLKQPQTMVIFRSQKENKLTLPGNLLK